MRRPSLVRATLSKVAKDPLFYAFWLSFGAVNFLAAVQAPWLSRAMSLLWFILCVVVTVSDLCDNAAEVVKERREEERRVVRDVMES